MRTVEITMEKRLRVAIELTLTEGQLEQLRNRDPFLYDMMEREFDSGNCYIEYDYAVTDESGNALVDWGDT